MGIIKKLFGKKDIVESESELKAKVLKKATENFNAASELAGAEKNIVGKSVSAYESVDQIKKNNIRTVLLEIAERGEAGVLSTSISDKIKMNKHDASTALSFLTKNNYVDAVNSPIGMKYYLTDAGKKHCLSKEFNS